MSQVQEFRTPENDEERRKFQQLGKNLGCLRNKGGNIVQRHEETKEKEEEEETDQEDSEEQSKMDDEV